MPRIPVPRTPRNSSGLRPVQVSGATPAETGGALQQFGNTVGGATAQFSGFLARERNHADKVLLDEKMLQVDDYRNEKHYGEKEGYLTTTKGKPAMEKFEGTNAEWEDFIEARRNELPHPNQQRMWDNMIQGRKSQWEQQAAAHLTRETSRYEGQVLESTLDNFTREMPYLNPGERAIKYLDGAIKIQEYGESNGLPPEAIADMVRKWEGGTQVGVLQARDAADDLEGMQDALAAPQADSMKPSERAKWDGYVTEKIEEREDARWVDGLFTNFSAAEQKEIDDNEGQIPASVKRRLLQEGREKHPDDLSRRTRINRAVKARLGETDALAEEGRKEAADAAWGQIVAGRKPAAHLLDAVGGVEKARLLLAWEGRNEKASDKVSRKSFANLLGELNDGTLTENKQKAYFSRMNADDQIQAHRAMRRSAGSGSGSGSKAPKYTDGITTSERRSAESGLLGIEKGDDEYDNWIISLNDYQMRWHENNSGKVMMPQDVDTMYDTIREASIFQRRWLRDKETNPFLLTPEERQKGYLKIEDLQEDRPFFTQGLQAWMTSELKRPPTNEEIEDRADDILFGLSPESEALKDEVIRHSMVFQREQFAASKKTTVPKLLNDIRVQGERQGKALDPQTQESILDLLMVQSPDTDRIVQRIIDNAPQIGDPAANIPEAVPRPQTTPPPTSDKPPADGVEPSAVQISGESPADQGGALPGTGKPEQKLVAYKDLTPEQKSQVRSRSRRLGLNVPAIIAAAAGFEGPLSGGEKATVAAHDKAAKMVAAEIDASVERFMEAEGQRLGRQGDALAPATPLSSAEQALAKQAVDTFTVLVKNKFDNEKHLAHARGKLIALGLGGLYSALERFIWIDDSFDEETMVDLNTMKVVPKKEAEGE